jgi:hypothetical protein
MLLNLLSIVAGCTQHVQQADVQRLQLLPV